MATCRRNPVTLTCSACPFSSQQCTPSALSSTWFRTKAPQVPPPPTHPCITCSTDVCGAGRTMCLFAPIFADFEMQHVKSPWIPVTRDIFGACVPRPEAGAKTQDPQCNKSHQDVGAGERRMHGRAGGNEYGKEGASVKWVLRSGKGCVGAVRPNATQSAAESGQDESITSAKESPTPRGQCFSHDAEAAFAKRDSSLSPRATLVR